MTSPENEIAITRRQILSVAALAGGMSIAVPAAAQISLGRALEALQGVITAETLTDRQMAAFSSQMADQIDRQNRLASPDSAHGRRVALLSRGLTRSGGLDLDIRAYESDEVNAFAMADGTIRIYGGLLDRFTDDEVRYVIGHEIGHVAEGHSRSRMQSAMRTEAVRDALAAADRGVGRLADSQLGNLFGSVVLAQHSQGAEHAADDYAVGFMRANGFPVRACVTALEKLAALGGGRGPSFLSTHPSPESRARRVRARL